MKLFNLFIFKSATVYSWWVKSPSKTQLVSLCEAKKNKVCVCIYVCEMGFHMPQLKDQPKRCHIDITTPCHALMSGLHQCVHLMECEYVCSMLLSPQLHSQCP